MNCCCPPSRKAENTSRRLTKLAVCAGGLMAVECRTCPS
jgi:hypothetical protein